MFKKIPFSSALLAAVFVASSLATPAFTEGNETLPDVAARGNIADVRRLLEAGVSVEYRQARTGWTPLITAVRAGKTAVATLLLDRGANPNTAGPTGYTPLMAATQTRNVPLIRTLLLRGADPDKATAKGLTPLMLAAGNTGDVQQDLECVKMLLRGGADPDKKHTSGATAVAIARERGAASVVAYLSRVGAAGSVAVAAGNTAVVADGTITGTVLYRERIAVPPAAFAVVRLLDIQPKTPVVLARTVTPFAGKQVPVAFSLPYKAATLSRRPNPKFALDARIVSGGAARFRTAKPVPTLSPGSRNKNVVLPLVMVSEEEQTRLAAEAVTATDAALALSGVDFVGKQASADLTINYTASFLGNQLIRVTATSTQGDYGNRTDRFYFSEGTDSEGFPVLRAAYLSARRIARAEPSGEGGRSDAVPGEYEKVSQKIILDDGGKPVIATKTVDARNETVSDADVTAARNFSRLVAAEALRAVNKRAVNKKAAR